jgi:hypothetical protein
MLIKIQKTIFLIKEMNLSEHCDIGRSPMRTPLYNIDFPQHI